VNNGLSVFIAGRSLAAKNNIIYYATDKGIYRSTNEGAYWAANCTGLKSLNINAIAIDDSLLFAGTDTDGVYISIIKV